MGTKAEIPPEEMKMVNAAVMPSVKFGEPIR